MKTTLYLMLILAATLVPSCTKDDENAENNNGEPSDPIIGTWIIESAISFEGEVSEEAELTDCEKQSNLEFKADNTVAVENFFILGEEETCFFIGLFGTWENQGNGIYTLDVVENEFDEIEPSFEENTLVLDVFDDEGNLTDRTTFIKAQ